MKNKRLRRWLRGSCAWMLICVFGFMSIGVAEGLAPADTVTMSEPADESNQVPTQEPSGEPTKAPTQESGDGQGASGADDDIKASEQPADAQSTAAPTATPTAAPTAAPTAEHTAYTPTLGELCT